MRRKLHLKCGDCNYLNLVIVIALSFITFSVGATNYYVSATGSDGNLGTSESSAWRSLAKVGSTTFKPGDQVLFRKGDTFYGALQVKGSGTASSPISFGAYGSGALPVISGLSKISNWEPHGNGIYKSNVTNVSQLNLVLLNNKPVEMGRYPNSGYLTFESHSGKTTIIDNDLGSQPNWTGAVAVIRTNHWILDRNRITSHSGSNITFQASSGYTPRDGFGYFIQSDLKTLDQKGEWYYSNGVLYMYFGSDSPNSNTVEVGSIDILANMKLLKYIEFNGIEFKGANQKGIFVDYSENVKIQNCKITACGQDGILAQGAKYLELRGNSISNCLSIGVKTKWDSNDAKFIENTITDIGMLPGMGGSADGTYMALSTKSKNALIQYNHIERVGYNGIDFHGDNTKVENNYVNKFCQYKDDGGGIYSFFENNTAFRFAGVKILNNIVINGGGHEENGGINPNSPNQVEGIYTDGLTNSFEIAGNTVAYTASAGLFLNTPRWHNIHSNILVGNKKAQIHWNNLKMNGVAPGGNEVANNIIFNPDAAQHSMHLSDSYGEEILNFGSSNSNKYVSIQGNAPSFYTVTYNGKWNNDYYNLAEWKSKFGRDAGSQAFESPQNEYVFEYNNTKSSKSISLRHAMIDLSGKKYSGSITLAPYSSIVLLPDPDGDTDGGSNTIYREEDIFICEGEYYNGWNESGQYQRTLLATNGADSIVTTNLVVNPVYHVTENISINQGESYLNRTESGVYETVYQSSTGCDSIVTINLTVLQSGNNIPDVPDETDVTEIVEYVTICEGENYYGNTESGQYQRTESVSDNTTIKGINLIASDNFSDGTNEWSTFAATGYSINISNDEQEFYTSPSSMRIDCSENGDIIHYMQLITGGEMQLEQGKTYEISFNAKATTPFSIGNLIVVKGSSPWTDYGTYSDRKPNVTTEWSNIKVTFTANYTTSDATFRIYLGSSLPVGNSLYIDDFFFAEKSEQTDSQTNLITTYLTVLPTTYTVEDVTIQEGENYLGWTASGVYERTLTSYSGCDSIVTTNLTVTTVESNYFTPIWEGQNGQNHMNIGVKDARINSIPVEEGDEIAVYDGDLCVGVSKLNVAINPEDPDTYVFIKVSQCDGSGNGFIEGNKISYRIWDVSKQEEKTVNGGVTYQDDIEEWVTTGEFVCGGTSVVQLNLVKPEEPVSQSIYLEKGWNIISSFIAPTNPDLEVITQSLRDDRSLVKVQDEVGNTYEYWGNKNGWRNEIGAFQNTEGYKLRVKTPCTLNITGLSVNLPMNIPLVSGANLVSFPVNQTVNAMQVIQPLIEQGILSKVQDEQGNSIEHWGNSLGWINGIGDFKAGEGYVLTVTDNGILSINDFYNKSTSIPNLVEPTVYFNVDFQGNGLNHMNLNVTNINEVGLNIGDELAAYDGDICVGAVRLTDAHFRNNAVSINASLSEEDLVNGFTNGNRVVLKSWDAGSNQETIYDPTIDGIGVLYQSLTSSFIQLKSAEQLENISPVELNIDVFPNPANDNVTVRFSVLPGERTMIVLTDITGKQLLKQEVLSTHENLNVQPYPAGIYFVRIESGNYNKIDKLIIN
ncbi:MAG TPA: right-handed parallel beta-helix repeat-containing protein [Draconibacterium sp.]|nr:right-handed parallel beta-helix repeat-containing protein [Draconibacterium sp.]